MVSGWEITKADMQHHRDGCRHASVPASALGFIGWCMHNLHGYLFFLGAVMFIVCGGMGAFYFFGWMQWNYVIYQEERKRRLRLRE